MSTKTPPPVTSCVHSTVCADTQRWHVFTKTPPQPPPPRCHRITRRIPSNISLFIFYVFITSLPHSSFSVARSEFVRRPALLPSFSGSYEHGRPAIRGYTQISQTDFLGLTPYLNCDPHKSFYVVFTNKDRAVVMATINVLTSWPYETNVDISKLIQNTVMQRQSTFSL
jgi:hypothetical protein